MEQTAIREKLTGIFRSTFDDSSIELRDDMTANDVSNWDSLTHMLMIGEVENTFAIKFKLKELNKLKDVGTLIILIAEKMAS